MDGDPRGDRHDERAENALSERVARLEVEVRALRSDLAALVSQRPLRREETAPGVVPLRSAQQAPAPLNAGSTPAATPALAEPGLVQPGLVEPVRGVAVAAQRRQANPSLESQLGTRILSKVAVVLLLLGVAWFLKWAFDNRWIGPGGRVLLGLIAGAGVIWWSERFRRQQLAAFSYALKAVGSGALYLSLWAGVHLYHLAPPAPAFVAMAGVTAWNAAMAWRQDAQLLAGYALLGAYLTPLLLRTGIDHQVFLFSYLLLIAVALLGLLRSKPWTSLAPGALAATAGIFIAWYVAFFDPSKALATAIFAVALWAAFAAVPLLSSRTETVIANVLTALGTAVFGALTIYSVLADSGGREWEPWCALGFAVVYLAIARLARTRSVMAAVHLGIGIAFITAAIPLKASGREILLGWLAEAVALIACSLAENADRNSRNTLRSLGCAVLLLGIGGVLLQSLLFTDGGQGLLNRDFATAMAGVAALALVLGFASWMRTQDAASAEDSSPVEASAGSWIAAGSLVLVNVVLLVAMHRELHLLVITQRASGQWDGVGNHADFAFSAWMMAQGAIMLAAGFWRRAALARWIGLVLLTATVIKMFAYDMRHLTTGYRVVSYLGLGVLLMAVSFAYQKDWLGLLNTGADDEGKPPSGESQA